MSTPTIYLATEAVPAASLPHLTISVRQGEDDYKVKLQIDAAFSDAQIAACLVGSTASIAVGGMTYTGTVTGFGSRPGYSVVVIEDASCAH